MLKRLGVAALAMGVVVMASGTARADAGSDAKKSVEAFFAAVQDGDLKTVTAAVTATPEQNDAVHAYLDLMVATTQLQKAAVAKFGAGAKTPFGIEAAATAAAARAKAVHEATAKVVGDSVLLSIAGDESNKVAPLTLVVKKSPDGWKIDGGSLFNLSAENRDETKERAALSAKLAAITKQMIAEINEGKYASGTDAYQEFWARSVKAAKDGTAPVEPPATRPATRP